MLLDLSAGGSTAGSSYHPREPPRLGLAGGRIPGWAAAVARARTASEAVTPGRLAAAAPGRGAYVGVRGAGRGVEAVAAADRAGRIGRVSLGSAASLPARAVRAWRSARWV